MSDTKYIVEYLGGCKGDMLTGILNRESLSINNLRKVDRLYQKTLKDVVNFINPKGNVISLIEFENKLKSLNEKFTTSHNLYFLRKSYYDLLDQLNIKIIKITFEPKYYQTIRIEHLIKNLKTREPALDQRFSFSEIDFQDFFSIDYFLKNENTPITDENRAQKLHLLLKNQNHDFMNERIFNSQKANQHRILWSYQDLYIDINLSHDFFNDIDMDFYKETVEKSWLPDEIHVFGETWKPREYGYRSF